MYLVQPLIVLYAIRCLLGAENWIAAFEPSAEFKVHESLVNQASLNRSLSMQILGEGYTNLSEG